MIKIHRMEGADEGDSYKGEQKIKKLYKNVVRNKI